MARQTKTAKIVRKFAKKKQKLDIKKIKAVAKARIKAAKKRGRR